MRKAKTTLAVLGALVLLVLIAPVMAQNEVVIKSQDRGITPVFSMTVATGEQSLPLSVGTNTKLDGPQVNITSNSGYTLSAKDAMLPSPDPKPVGATGRMIACISNGNFKNAPAQWVSAPFEVGINGDNFVPMTGTNQVIKTSTTGGILLETLKFRQNVTIADPVLAATEYYRITVTVTGTAG